VKNSTIVRTLLAFLYYVVIVGFIVPSLISDKSTISFILGAGILILSLVVPVLYFNRKTDDVKINNQKENN
jgi:hypothetical protein